MTWDGAMWAITIPAISKSTLPISIPWPKVDCNWRECMCTEDVPPHGQLSKLVVFPFTFPWTMEMVESQIPLTEYREIWLDLQRNWKRQITKHIYSGNGMRDLQIGNRFGFLIFSYKFRWRFDSNDSILPIRWCAILDAHQSWLGYFLWIFGENNWLFRKHRVFSKHTYYVKKQAPTPDTV